MYKSSVVRFCFLLLWLLMYQEQLVDLIKKVAVLNMVIAKRNSIPQGAQVPEKTVFVKLYLWGL